MFSSSLHHWNKYIVLLLLSGIQLLLNVSLIVPVALESMLVDTLKIDITQYALLCSVYSWPAVVLTILGAIMVNQCLGIRNAVVLFMFVLCIGQAIMGLGAFVGMYWLMMASRIIVGVGGVIVFTTTDVIAARWFKGHITFVFAIIGTFGRIGASGGIYFNAYVYHLFKTGDNGHSTLGFTVLFSVLYLVLGTVLSLVLAVIDKRADKMEEKDDNKASVSKFSIREIFNFNANFWLAITPCILFLCAYYPFADIAQVFIVSKYGLSIDYANSANLLVFLVPVVAPLFGLIINWTGYNINWALAGILVACGSYLTYLFSDGEWQLVPYIASFMLGLSYSCVNTALWSAPPLLVSNHQLVTAYSVLEAGLNLGFAITGVITGPLIDNYGYFVLGLFFISLLVMAMFVTVLLIVNLINTNWSVNKSGWDRRRGLISADLLEEKVELMHMQDESVVSLTAGDDSTGTDEDMM